MINHYQLEDCRSWLEFVNLNELSSKSWKKWKRNFPFFKVPNESTMLTNLKIKFVSLFAHSLEQLTLIKSRQSRKVTFKPFLVDVASQRKQGKVRLMKWAIIPSVTIKLKGQLINNCQSEMVAKWTFIKLKYLNI